MSELLFSLITLRPRGSGNWIVRIGIIEGVVLAWEIWWLSVVLDI